MKPINKTPAARVDYIDDVIIITSYKGDVVNLSPSFVTKIYLCRYEDPAQDEEFFILLGKERFWIIGPFVEHMLDSLYTFRDRHPEIPCCEIIVHCIPWKLREPGFCKLRLFPIAGLGCFPIRDFPCHTSRGEENAIL
jgi:hypothetical protein